MFDDNYAYLLAEKSSGECAAVDPADPDVIEQAVNSEPRAPARTLAATASACTIYCRVAKHAALVEHEQQLGGRAGGGLQPLESPVVTCAAGTGVRRATNTTGAGLQVAAAGLNLTTVLTTHKVTEGPQ